MLTTTDILKKLADLDKELEAAQGNVTIDPDKPTCNNGFVAGLSMARDGIRRIFADVHEDNRQGLRLFDKILQCDGQYEATGECVLGGQCIGPDCPDWYLEEDNHD